MTAKKMAPRANARPEKNWKHESFYAPPSELQSLGEQFAARWIAAAERFASSFFRSLTDPPTPAVESALQAARDAHLRLSPADLPSPEHWQLVALLCAFAERRERPTIETVLAVANAARMALPGGGGDPAAELRQILECESSAAGILSWARELQECSRRDRQFKRLWRALRGWLAEPIGDEGKQATPIVVRRARRMSA